MFLCGCCLLQRLVENEVQKQVITAEHAADFAASLEMHEQFLVHELWTKSVSRWAMDSKQTRTFLSSGCEAFDMVASWGRCWWS